MISRDTQGKAGVDEHGTEGSRVGAQGRWRTGNEPGGSKMNGADARGAQVLFTNVHVFDGVSEKRVENANVLVEDNLIKQISAGTITADGARVIDGGGGTLMPGIMALRS